MNADQTDGSRTFHLKPRDSHDKDDGTSEAMMKLHEHHTVIDLDKDPNRFILKPIAPEAPKPRPTTPSSSCTTKPSHEYSLPS